MFAAMHEESWTHVYLEPLWETLHVTFFVMVVMMLMEFVELYRMRRKKESRLIAKVQGSGEGRHWLQLLMAAMLGLIPGCVGGFMAGGGINKAISERRNNVKSTNKEEALK